MHIVCNHFQESLLWPVAKPFIFRHKKAWIVAILFRRVTEVVTLGLLDACLALPNLPAFGSWPWFLVLAYASGTASRAIFLTECEVIFRWRSVSPVLQTPPLVCMLAGYKRHAVGHTCLLLVQLVLIQHSCLPTKIWRHSVSVLLLSMSILEPLR